MVQVQVCEDQKPLQQVDASWISKNLNKNRVMGNPICVKVSIETDTVHLILSTSLCKDHQKPKPSNDIERRITFLWDDLVMSKDDLDGRTIKSFLAQLDHWVSFAAAN